MHPWHDITFKFHPDEPVPAIIEVPRGSKVKYELDKKYGIPRVDRILFSAVHYPANYGFIPQTLGLDGDPLDILILCQEPVVPMSLMYGKPIGVMEMTDQGQLDDKIIAVHSHDPEFSHVNSIDELPPHRLKEVKRFFEDYKALENKVVTVDKFLDRAAAHQVIEAALKLYQEKKPRA